MGDVRKLHLDDLTLAEPAAFVQPKTQRGAVSEASHTDELGWKRFDLSLKGSIHERALATQAVVIGDDRLGARTDQARRVAPRTKVSSHLAACPDAAQT
jgi:hypothetical protein